MVAWIIIALTCVIYTIVMQCYFIAILIGILFYVTHALLWTDHIFYNPVSDYKFKFNSSLSFSGALTHHQFKLFSPLPANVDTCILPIILKANGLGFLFDPYVELRTNEIVSRQYFERGTNGQRFLNLTRLLESLQKINEPIQVSCRYCSIQEGDVTLLGFNNTSYCNKRILIISPHADDAELAAFAFYKHADSAMIATITAGEIDAKSYEVIAGHGAGNSAGNIAGQDNKIAAGFLKGRLRAWDSIAVPMWAGHHVQAIHLGYFCMTLKAMFEQPDIAIASRETGKTDVRAFRNFNKQALRSDQQGYNSWRNLLADLTQLIDEYRPDVIVTPHPILDAQIDHVFSTRAILTACEASNINPDFLLYANHNHHTDMYPFGVEHSDLPLPPHFESNVVAEKLFSFPLSLDDQRDKICALQMMHDLNRPTSFKKQLRQLLQRMIGRSAMPYGDDDYLRKAIRQQELFWVMSLEELKKQFD